jgi:hypothetical protein
MLYKGENQYQRMAKVVEGKYDVVDRDGKSL